MSLEAISGRTYGPVTGRISAEKVAEYIAATGDSADRWVDVAPPSYAGALLFAVAPQLINDPDVGASTRVLVHTEQRFVWHAPLEIDAPIRVTGTVTRVRARGAVNFVTLDTAVVGDGGPLLDSTSTFLMGSEAAAPPGPDEGEPEVTVGGEQDQTPSGVELVPGGPLGEMRCGASRLDLVRYAGASGDLNPIHFDHDAARNAGLDGIVVHGLLMTAWLARMAAGTSQLSDPLADMKLRFRSALRPGVPAVITRTVEDAAEDHARLGLVLRSGDVDLVTATATVRR